MKLLAEPIMLVAITVSIVLQLLAMRPKVYVCTDTSPKQTVCEWRSAGDVRGVRVREE